MVFDNTKDVLKPKPIEIVKDSIKRLDIHQDLNPNKINYTKGIEETEFNFLAVGNEHVIKNPRKDEILIDSLDVNILEAEEYKHTEIVMNHGTLDNVLEIYLINNGNKKSEIKNFLLDIEIKGKNGETVLSSQDDKELFRELFSCDNEKEFVFEKGEIHRAYKLNFNKKGIDLFEENKDFSTIHFQLRDTNNQQEFSVAPLFYFRPEKKFNYGGYGGGQPPEKTNIVELDVNNLPKSKKITLMGINQKISSNNSELLDLTFIAKNSIHLKYSTTFHYEEKSITSKEKEISIFVPIYNIRGTYPNDDFFKVLTSYDADNLKENQLSFTEENDLKYNDKYLRYYFESKEK